MKYKNLFLIGLLFMISACGSSVSESEKDTGAKDIIFNDVDTTEDSGEVTKDVISDKGGADEVICDSGCLPDDSGTKDEGTTEDAGADGLSSEDIFTDTASDVKEDTSGGEDITISDTPEDIYSDTGIADSGSDAGADVIEDVGSPYCKPGDKKQYKCQDGTLIDYCLCENKGCKPHCDKIGTESEGWYDCSGQLIKWASCEKCNVYCGALGSKGEGWYSDCGGLIKWDQCAPDW
ncbi:MAG: MSCRAMM family adhesin SdrC, partial [Deltaproteobacteria bacterium]|nr:MSCRAMM family adhesin SdrC [Deltaproteobacteria bacterium]